MKLALVHDYLREYGGAERVLEVFHEIWPKAPLFTSFVDWKAMGQHSKRFDNWDIRTSWVQNYGFVKKFISPLRFLAPKVWESLDLSEFDVVLSSSGWFMCRGVRVPKNCIHISYIHHPPRNLYGYPTGSNLQKYPLVRYYASFINFFLRHYDFDTAQRVNYLISNSAETARRVEKFYRRQSTVIYPPVNVDFVKPKNKSDKNKNKYFLSVGRLTYSKRIDLAIEACNRLRLPLKIVGTGKEKEKLEAISGPTIEFVGAVSDTELNDLYSGGALALIFSALEEDFGIVPVEAMAHGIPVIALAQGGVKETVIDGTNSTGSGQATGIWFDKPEVEDLIEAIKKFNNNKTDWENNCIDNARKYSKDRFIREIKAYVENAYLNK